MYITNAYFDRTDVSEGTGVNKTREPKEWSIWHYWDFLNKALNFNQMSAIDAMIY